MRRTVSAFLQHIISQLGSHPVTTPIRVALVIMNRLAEGSLSVELLCLKNRVRDGAILLLSLHELQLDLQYIALDPSRAGTWIDHTQKDRKPWHISSQMQEIYTTTNELDAEGAGVRSLFLVFLRWRLLLADLAHPLAVTYLSPLELVQA
jgi:hypothetical protein